MLMKAESSGTWYAYQYQHGRTWYAYQHGRTVTSMSLFMMKRRSALNMVFSSPDNFQVP